MKRRMKPWRAVDTEMVFVAEHWHSDLAGDLTLRLARWGRLLAATLWI